VANEESNRVRGANARRSLIASLSRRSAAIGAFAILSVAAGVLASVAAVPAVAMVATGVGDGASVFNGLPDYLKIQPPAQVSTLYAQRAGEQVPIASFFAQDRKDVPWSGTSEALKSAVLAAEDPRFFEEGPIDVVGTLRAAAANAAGHQLEGGSSITQQYVKNVLVQQCDALTDARASKSCYEQATATTLQRKLQELRYAGEVAKQYSKDQILTAYLNLVGFGGNVYGAQAAAEHYFGVPARTVSLAQAATLAAIINSPSILRIDQPGNAANGAANHYALTLARRNYVLDRMYVNHRITAQQREAAKATPIQPVVTTANSGCTSAAAVDAGFFCSYVKDELLNDPAFGRTATDRWVALNRGGLRIYTTLKLGLQQQAQAALDSYIPSTQPGMDLGASNISVEPGTGHIETMVENKSFDETSQGGPGATAVNYNTDFAFGGSQGFQTGSAFKAFTIAAWLEAGHTLSEIIDASQHAFPMSDFHSSCGPLSGPPWVVSNDEGSASRLSVMGATAQSVNTAFAMMGTKLDLCSILHTAEALGVHPASSANPLTSVPSMILGVNYISPLTMATAYAAIADGGIVCTPVAVERVTGPHGIPRPVTPSSCTRGIPSTIASGVAYDLQGVLQPGGTAASANPQDGVPMLAKTGTTDHAVQNWLVTSTTRIATATWVGNVSGSQRLRSEYFHGINGGNVKFDIARRILTVLDQRFGGTPFTPPSPAIVGGPVRAVG
jgi:membrane peptidoglycan carboxypeptidase